MTPERLSEYRGKASRGATVRRGVHRGVAWEVRERWRPSCGGDPAARVPGHSVAVALPHTDAFDRAVWRYRSGDHDVDSLLGVELSGYGAVVEGGSRWHVLVACTGAPPFHYRGADTPPWLGPVPTDDEAEASVRAWIDRAVDVGLAPGAP